MELKRSSWGIFHKSRRLKSDDEAGRGQKQIQEVHKSSNLVKLKLEGATERKPSRLHVFWFNTTIIQLVIFICCQSSGLAPSGAPNDFMMTHYLLLLCSQIVLRWEALIKHRLQTRLQGLHARSYISNFKGQLSLNMCFTCCEQELQEPQTLFQVSVCGYDDNHHKTTVFLALGRHFAPAWLQQANVSSHQHTSWGHRRSHYVSQYKTASHTWTIVQPTAIPQ